MDFTQRARFLVEQEKYDEAVSLLGYPGIESESQNSQFMLYIGAAMVGLNQLPEGLGAISSALQQRPENTALLDDLPSSVKAAISIEKLKAELQQGPTLNATQHFFLGRRDWVLGTGLVVALALIVYAARAWK